MELRRLGTDGPLVGAVGLGCAGLSWAYGGVPHDDDVSLAVIQTALDYGVTFLDTADIYGLGHNEELVGRALRGHRSDVVLATKVGLVVDDPATRAIHPDGSPEHLRAAVDASLYRLGTDVIDLCYLHRVDPAVPLVESWGAMADLVTAGKVRRLGLSEVTVAQAVEAHTEHPVTAVQSEFSLWVREPLGFGEDDPEGKDDPDGKDDNMIAWCRSHGAAFVPFAPLGRGVLTGAITATPAVESRNGGDPRQRLIDVVRAIAGRYRATPAQIALAWVLAQGDHVIPVPGTNQRRYLSENVNATRVHLADPDLSALNNQAALAGPT